MSDKSSRDTGGCPVNHTDYRLDRPAFWHYGSLNADRERAPILWNDSTRDGFWMIQRYDHVLEALNTPEVFSNRQVNAFDKSMTLRLLPQNLDGAPHRRLRALLSPFFNPRGRHDQRRPGTGKP